MSRSLWPRARRDMAWVPALSASGDAAQEAEWPRLAALRCRPGHPLALLTPARRHSRRSWAGLAFDMLGRITCRALPSPPSTAASAAGYLRESATAAASMAVGSATGFQPPISAASSTAARAKASAASLSSRLAPASTHGGSTSATHGLSPAPLVARTLASRAPSSCTPEKRRGTPLYCASISKPPPPRSLCVNCQCAASGLAARRACGIKASRPTAVAVFRPLLESELAAASPRCRCLPLNETTVLVLVSLHSLRSSSPSSRAATRDTAPMSSP